MNSETPPPTPRGGSQKSKSFDSYISSEEEEEEEQVKENGRIFLFYCFISVIGIHHDRDSDPAPYII